MTRIGAVKTVKDLLEKGDLVGRVRSESDIHTWYETRKIRVGLWTCGCQNWFWNAVTAYKLGAVNGNGNPKVRPCKHLLKMWMGWRVPSPSLEVINTDGF